VVESGSAGLHSTTNVDAPCPGEDLISVPSRFDHIYQIEKLAQFDKLFSRSWAVPVRHSHASNGT
jgi:hypothetical protein